MQEKLKSSEGKWFGPKTPTNRKSIDFDTIKRFLDRQGLKVPIMYFSPQNSPWQIWCVCSKERNKLGWRKPWHPGCTQGEQSEGLSVRQTRAWEAQASRAALRGWTTLNACATGESSRRFTERGKIQSWVHRKYIENKQMKPKGKAWTSQLNILW